ncbi:unnamed protein product, partial [Timema podura]|nr:unnamed protein product [Timema podura]
MVVEAKQRLDDNQENQCLDVILNLLYIAGLWHKQDTRLYFIYRCFIMFMYLHFFVLMGHVFLNEDIDGIIDNAGHLFTFIPTGCLIFSLLKQRDTYSQVIQHIQTTFSHEGADSKAKRAIIRSSIRREKELTKWYCTALTVAIGAYDVLPLTGLTFTTVGGTTYIHGSLPINTWSPFDRSIPLVFALEYVYQCCCASFIVFMTTACDLLSVLLIMYSAHQFEIINVAMESLVEGAAAEEGADTGKVLSLKMLRNKQGGGDYGKVEDVHEEQEDFIEDSQDKMMFYKGGDVQESDLWENNLKNSGTKLTKNMSELHKIVKFHQGLLTNVDKLRLLLEPVIFLHYLMSSAALCLVGYMFTTVGQ